MARDEGKKGVGIQVESVYVHSDGLRLTGDRYYPQGTGWDCPNVVCCQGLGSARTANRQEELAERFSAEGMSAVIFDYRGWGDSEGDRGRIVPWEQVRDVRAVVSYVLANQGETARPVGLAGTSFGGAIAVVAGATDRRVAAVSAAMPFGDGSMWMRSTRNYEDWRAWLKLLEANEKARARDGGTVLVELEEIVVGGRDERRHFRAGSDSRKVWLSSGMEILSFKPQDYIGGISPRPLLLIHGTEDCVIPVEETVRLMERAGEGAKLRLLEGCGHFSMYHDWFEEYSNMVVQFHAEALLR